MLPCIHISLLSLSNWSARSFWYEGQDFGQFCYLQACPPASPVALLDNSLTPRRGARWPAPPTFLQLPPLPLLPLNNLALANGSSPHICNLTWGRWQATPPSWWSLRGREGHTEPGTFLWRELCEIIKRTTDKKELSGDRPHPREAAQGGNSRGGNECHAKSCSSLCSTMQQHPTMQQQRTTAMRKATGGFTSSCWGSSRSNQKAANSNQEENGISSSDNSRDMGSLRHAE